jgi:hypothetical protein
MKNDNIDAPAVAERPVERGLRLREDLHACDLGNTLFLKLCGFIQDQHARLLEVDEHNYRMKIGFTRWERFWHGVDGHDPLLVTLAVRRDETPGWERRSHAADAIVEIDVRPAGFGWSAAAFDSTARHIVRKLRLHLMTS